MLDYKFGDVLPVGSDHGYVKLLETMGSDEAIVDAARISYDRRGRSADRALIRYLKRHRHTSPFEMGEMKFELKMPIFVARQWIRHRTASLNEVSARYTQLPAEMFLPLPDEFMVQSTDNKQGRGDHSVEEDFSNKILDSHTQAYALYEEMLEAGVAREIARGVLPLNVYTKFVWKIDLHNLMHFLHLRLDPHAQKEIREYAEIIEKLVSLHFPLSFEAFVDYQRDSYLCSRMEVELLQKLALISTATHEWIIQQAKGLGMSDREIVDFIKRFRHGTQSR